MKIELDAKSSDSNKDKLKSLNIIEPVMKGIFELDTHESDSNKDTLKWCFAMPGKPRPTDFSVKQGSGHKLVKLKRFVLNEKETVNILRAANAEIYFDSQGGWANEVLLKDSAESREAIAELKKLKMLRSIYVEFANEELIDALAELKILRSVGFRCEVSLELLDKLATGAPTLERLQFHCQNFSNEHGKVLAQAKKLRQLELRHNKGPNTGLEMLPNLTSKDISPDENSVLYPPKP